MRIMTFFTVFTLIFIIELVILTFVQHPTVSFVQLMALSAFVVGNIPWYTNIYLLAGVSLSVFVQGFCMVTNIAGFGCLAIASIVCGEMIINNIVAQTVLVLALIGIFMGINCSACFTLLNSGIIILVTPFLIYSLR